jgi:hypothetical protein
MSYLIPPGVHAADVRGDLVFLDAVHDAYLCAPRSLVGTLAGSSPHGVPPDAGLIAELMAAGLLVEDPKAGDRSIVGPARTATSDYIGEGNESGRVGAAQVLLLAAAGIITALRMKLHGPARWLANAEPAGKPVNRPADLQKAVALAWSFERLRPWLPGSGRCLPSSLLLLQFLRLHGIEAQWVFGVRTYPFEAHCWIEKDGVVLNDFIEHVRWFTPIAIA